MTETPFRILAGALPAEPNFFTSDPVFQGVLERLVPEKTRAWLRPQLERMGALAAGPVERGAAIVDRQSPVLRPFDRWGNRVDEIVHHPAYRELEQISYGSGMIGMKYDPALRREHGPALQVAGFALSFLFAQTECGQSCPICMTDGVARVLELYGSEEQKRRWIPRLASRDVATLARGAMFLTEKQGGSDVGQNATRAVRQSDGTWRLHGEKWFCSNVDGELALALARPDDAPPGTRGLGLFLLPHRLADGTRNAKRIDRLKDKLGVRSMASGECVLEGAQAELVGELEHGFKQMAEMLNLSRLWNALCSVAIMRRAAYEATTYLRARRTFGRRAIEHGLVRETLADLNATEIAGKYLVFQLVHHLTASDAGSERDHDLVRMLTPLAKYGTAKDAVWAASEGIELLGGNGYIEDSPMPRLLRDAQVLPVWEGTTNILVLDGLRVVSKSGAHEALLAETERLLSGAPASLGGEADRVHAMTKRARQDLATIAAEGPDRASGLLKRFTDRLLWSYELALLVDAARTDAARAPILSAAVRRLLRRWADPDLRTSADDVAALVDGAVG